MDKKIIFYGTPLNKVLGEDQTDNDGSHSNKRSRINQQQTVRDSSGRQRFHGAFTGGFSAGYFNTVDSIEGFQPKTFVSHRGSRLQHGKSQTFSHKPEDYMDEEDLGEFGIAPKKIRVASHYFSAEDDEKPGSSVNSALTNLLKPVSISIGKQILEQSAGYCASQNAGKRSDRYCSNLKKFSPKNDFHGLGYKSLNFNQTVPQCSTKESVNPLMAMLGTGKRLKISGEAFGCGVLEEDDDCIDVNDSYGHDDIRNYDFNSKTTSDLKTKLQCGIKMPDLEYQGQDVDLLNGFVIAKNLESIHICDELENKYLPPNIPDEWIMPVRKSATFLPEGSSKNLTLKGSPTSVFNKKFIIGTDSSKWDNIESRAGLVLYSDLKAAKKSSLQDEPTGPSRGPEITKATLVRREMQWRPCKLLCKHFNVPNPYPDESYVGVKVANLIEQVDLKSTNYEDIQQCTNTHQEPASYELKQSIFNVIIQDPNLEEDQVGEDETESDSENDPQVVMDSNDKTRDDIDDSYNEQESLNEDPDIVVVPPPKQQEPEVIELLSSSSSSAASPPMAKNVNNFGEQQQHKRAEEEDDIDTYGPPLPPTLKLDSTNDRQSSRHRHSSRQRKKKKKHKKHKRG